MPVEKPFTSIIQIEKVDGGLVIVMPPARNRGMTIACSLTAIILLAIARFGFRGMPDPAAWVEPRWLSFLAGFVIPGPGYFQLVFYGAGILVLLLAVVLMGHSVRTYVTPGSIGVTHFWFFIPYYRIPLDHERIEDIKLGTHGNVYSGGKMTTLYNIEVHVKGGQKFSLADSLLGREEGERMLDLVLKAYIGE